MANHSEVTSRLRELRELARVTIQDAAAVVGVSYTCLWNVEHGYSKLTDRQVQLLQDFYVPKINERPKHVSRSLGAQKELSFAGLFFAVKSRGRCAAATPAHSNKNMQKLPQPRKKF